MTPLIKNRCVLDVMIRRGARPDPDDPHQK
jgi:hypothetical protein